jgi:hypothetical protein
MWNQLSRNIRVLIVSQEKTGEKVLLSLSAAINSRFKQSALIAILLDNPVDGTDGKLGRGFMSADKLEEVDIGNGDKPRPTFISANLQSGFREELIKLLKEYKDCFTWDYSEMPRLDRSIVEHRLPIKSGFKPYKQLPRKIYKDKVLADVKKEVERLLEANFIRPCRYVE